MPGTNLINRLRSLTRSEHDDLSIGDEAADEIERLHAENERLLEENSLLTHKVLTCGVAASHPDPKLSERPRDYGGKWDSPQAQQVRALRRNRDRLREGLRQKIELLRWTPPENESAKYRHSMAKDLERLLNDTADQTAGGDDGQ